MNKVLFSSNSDEWATPREFFDSINKEFEFDLDPCATVENHKCDKYYTIEENGLSKNWGGIEYFATHLIAKLINGLKKHFEKVKKTTR